jgi:hypothetical protein
LKRQVSVKAPGLFLTAGQQSILYPGIKLKEELEGDELEGSGLRDATLKTWGLGRWL